MEIADSSLHLGPDPLGIIAMDGKGEGDDGWMSRWMDNEVLTCVVLLDSSLVECVDSQRLPQPGPNSSGLMGLETVTSNVKDDLYSRSSLV